VALGSDLKLDFIFKKILGRNLTTNLKQWYEEFAGSLTFQHISEIFSDDIPAIPPNITTSSIQIFNQYTLTEDNTTSNKRAWIVCSTIGDLTTQLNRFIPPRFGQSYTARLFDNNNVEIPPTHASNWLFDYENGIVFFESNPINYGIVLPIKISVYRYIGNTLTTSGTGGGTQDSGEVFGEFILGEDISNNTIVYIDVNGKIKKASPNTTDIDKSYLLFLKNGGLLNDVRVLFSVGIFSNPFWNLSLGGQYFLEVGGTINNQPPSTGVSWKVGSAVLRNNEMVLYFKPEIPIKKL